MKNQSNNLQFDSSETVTLHLNSYSKIEQAELVARFFINSNCNRHEAAITMCCIADLLSDVLEKTV